MILFLVRSGHPESMAQSCSRKHHGTVDNFFSSDEFSVWKDLESLFNHMG